MMKRSAYLAVLLSVPAMASAQPWCSGSTTIGPGNPPTSIIDITCTGTLFIQEVLMPLVLTLTVLVFLWGLVTYIWSAGDDKKIVAAKQWMFWGIIGITIALSVWGILAILSDTFGFGAVGVPLLPTMTSPSPTP